MRVNSERRVKSELQKGMRGDYVTMKIFKVRQFFYLFHCLFLFLFIFVLFLFFYFYFYFYLIFLNFISSMYFYQAAEVRRSARTARQAG